MNLHTSLAEDDKEILMGDTTILTDKRFISYLTGITVVHKRNHKWILREVEATLDNNIVKLEQAKRQNLAEQIQESYLAAPQVIPSAFGAHRIVSMCLFVTHVAWVILNNVGNVQHCLEQIIC